MFLIDEKTGARTALRRVAPTAAEPNGLWHADHQTFSTSDLLGILAAEPERISPAALLRPVFQDFLFSTTAQVGGPAGIAYLAQSTVLFERILGYQTPPIARFSSHAHRAFHRRAAAQPRPQPEQVFAEEDAQLALRLAARSMPIETKQKLAAAGNALDAELTTLVDWLQSQGQGPRPVCRHRRR